MVNTKVVVTSNGPLIGKIKISASKNAVLPIIASALLSKSGLVITNVPHLTDVSYLFQLIFGMNVQIKHHLPVYNKHAFYIGIKDDNIDTYVKCNNATQMRASILLIGPLLTRFGECKIPLPGGCNIGERPIDMHIDGLVQMGADIVVKDNVLIGKVSGKLQGCVICMKKVSVGATENLMMAATLAEGVTVLKNTAIEPEVSDLAMCLVKMGARIEGIGTKMLTIQGVESLHYTEYKVIPDRIEAGSYALAAAITRGCIKLCNVRREHMNVIINYLECMQVRIKSNNRYVIIDARSIELCPVNIITNHYPFFPSDMQAQFMALLSLCKGVSVINEQVYESRFGHVEQLNKMGANIVVNGNVAQIYGQDYLYGYDVEATDLRASMGLVIAALGAKHGAKTVISNAEYLYRGYENFQIKLMSCGAKIKANGALFSNISKIVSNMENA